MTNQKETKTMRITSLAVLLLCGSAFSQSSAPYASGITPQGGTGLSATFTITVSLPLGISDFENMFFAIHNGPTAPPNSGLNNQCVVTYAKGAAGQPFGFLALLNDAGTGVPQFTEDGSPTIYTQSGQGVNSYCSLAGPPTHILSGNTLIFTVPLTFNLGPMSGQMGLFLDGIGYAGGESGWTGVFPGWTVAPASSTAKDFSASMYSTPLNPAVDDYSGALVQLPTADARTLPDVYLSPDIPVFALGSYYNLIVTNARPNSQVWALATNVSDIPALNPGPWDGTTPLASENWCPAQPMFPNQTFIPPTGACLLGSTDSTGYFASSYVASPIPGSVPILGDTITKVWVGAPQDPASYAGAIYFFIQDPSTGLPTYTPDSAGHRKARSLTLSSGLRVELPYSRKPDVVEPSSTFAKDGAGYRYDFVLDTRAAKMIRVGSDTDYEALGDPGPDQNGWLTTGIGWIAFDASARRSRASKFSLLSSWKPGPVPVFFRGTPAPMTMQGHSADNVAVARATNILKDSTQKIVIGPAIAPGISEANLRLLVRTWKDSYNLPFLAPLLASSDFAAGLDLLKPSTDFERSVVDCLRNAF